MASIAEVIDFLMNLMRDEDTRSEFDRNPDAALADRGLADMTGQDVRDARLMMADCGSAQPRADRPAERSGGGDNDPVREIHYTTTHFEVGDVTTTVITVNDNDTVIVDSFNNDVTAIQDNDTTDIDVISIEDNDTVTGEEEEGPEGEQGDEEELDPAAGVGSGADEGAAPDAGELLGGADSTPDFDPETIGAGSTSELDEASLEDTDSGASEGFAPDQDSGFGAQPELGAEAGFTPDEPLDELVG